MKGLLLDTHIWIWLMEGSKEINHKQRKMINEAAQQSVVGIAAISIWEAAMLVEKGRIKLEKPLLAWVQEALALPGVELKPLTPEIAVESSQLPGNFHGDPADRLIVATARMHQLTLLTQDKKILDYAKKEFLSAV
ncbi:MAG TPA: type II toxin-antitoxin system VapC family toxin [Gammaproteobacteria bacterium]|nr:type II toxin-antitoxin system VapC family toxin [Gammaproteobacteria bacterium]